MNIEILHIEDCPSWEAAIVRTHEALGLLGHANISVTARVLRTSEEAAATAFAGSPTITLASADSFPSDGRTDDLACRVYATSEGLKGTPTTEQIADALRPLLNS